MLARLLALNQERYDQETRLGAHGKAGGSGTKAKGSKRKKAAFQPTIAGM
ncbi:MAG: hypothetical protein LVT47_10555 [Cyanobacteria bacterium LVE1205-1]